MGSWKRDLEGGREGGYDEVFSLSDQISILCTSYELRGMGVGESFHHRSGGCELVDEWMGGTHVEAGTQIGRQT